MSRISKMFAENIAIKLTAPSLKVADELKSEYQNLVTEIYEAQTPQAVKDCAKKHPDWVYSRRLITFSGHGFRWESVTGSRAVICNNGSDAVLKLNDKTADKITKAKRKYEKAYEDHKQLKNETENALLALRTYDRIKKEFPTAEKYLPPPMSNALVVNFDSLKKRLEKQIVLSKADTTTKQSA